MNRLKECREAAGLTQKYVALSLGVKGPSVSNWESGKTKPTMENFSALAKLYGVSVDYLLGGDQQQETAFPNPKQQQIFSELGNMSEEQLEEVLRYAEYVKQKK